MRAAHGVRAVHDLHVWTLTSGKEAMSAHVLVDDLAGGQHILGDLQHLLRERFGIEHATLQLETDRSPLLKITRAREGSPHSLSSSGREPTTESPRTEERTEA